MTREQAIEELTELLPEEFLSEYADAIKIAIEALEQEPKMGKWIYRKKEDLYRCSLCAFPCHKDNMGAIPTRYCAECGAEMQEE